MILNRMIVTGESSASVLAEVQSLIDDLESPARFELTIDPPYYPSWETDTEHPLALSLARAYAGRSG